MGGSLLKGWDNSSCEAKVYSRGSDEFSLVHVAGFTDTVSSNRNTWVGRTPVNLNFFSRLDHRSNQESRFPDHDDSQSFAPDPFGSEL